MAELQKVVGIDLEGQTNPGSLAKCKSGSLQIYLWLSACPALKKNRSAKGRHFMQNQGALYIPAQADNGASWRLWDLPVPMVVLKGELFPCWVKPRSLALEAWFPRSSLIPNCSAS